MSYRQPNLPYFTGILWKLEYLVLLISSYSFLNLFMSIRCSINWYAIKFINSDLQCYFDISLDLTSHQLMKQWTNDNGQKSIIFKTSSWDYYLFSLLYWLQNQHFCHTTLSNFDCKKQLVEILVSQFLLKIFNFPLCHTF